MYYLPEGSPVLESIKEVEQNWSTNVMIIYIDSPRNRLMTDVFCRKCPMLKNN